MQNISSLSITDYPDVVGQNNHADDDDDVLLGNEETQPSDSYLFKLVQSADWAGTLARVTSCPSEARTVNSQGKNPLHVACKHDAPAVVIQNLLKVYPEAATNVGSTRMTPIHITCSSSHASVHVVRVLLELGHADMLRMRDLDGDTPLHTACRCGAPIDVIRVLLSSYPHASLERDYEGLTPLLRLWVRYFVILGTDVIDAVHGPADLTGELEEAWRKTELLLAGAIKALAQPVSAPLLAMDVQNPERRVLHAAAAVDCPRAVVKMATRLYPRQLGEQDFQGDTPLLRAARAPIYKVRDLSSNGYNLDDIEQELYPDGLAESSSTSNSPEDASQPDQPSVIEILLTAHQEAASVTDLQGRLPLHVALSTGKAWKQGIQALLEAYPEALAVRDPIRKLFPFMLAAQGKTAEIETIYELLKRNPSVIEDLEIS